MERTHDSDRPTRGWDVTPLIAYVALLLVAVLWWLCAVLDGNGHDR